MLKVAVIGGGVAGLFSAWELLRRGAAVTLFEKGEIGRGCSWKAAGMLAPVNELEFQELDLFRAGLASRNLYPEIARQLGDIGLEPSGTLEIGLMPDDHGYLRRLFEFQVEQGQEVYWLSGDAIRDKEPFVSGEVQQAIWSPNDIQVDNRKLVQSLAKAIRALGGQIHEHCEIQTWKETETGAFEIIGQGESWFADRLLLTIGAEKFPQKLPYQIYPIRGEMLALQPPQGPFLQKVVRIHNKILGKAYVVPKEGRILCGSTSEEKGRRAVNTAGGMLDILRKCYRAVPGIYELDVLETWAGLRPSTLNRLPVCDREADREVYHLNGLYRHGILLSPLLARSIAERIMGGEQDPLTQPFQLPEPLLG